MFKAKFGGGWAVKSPAKTLSGLTAAELASRNAIKAAAQPDPEPQPQSQIQTDAQKNVQGAAPNEANKRVHISSADWDCPQCHFRCFGTRLVCPKCLTPNPNPSKRPESKPKAFSIRLTPLSMNTLKEYKNAVLENNLTPETLKDEEILDKPAEKNNDSAQQAESRAKEPKLEKIDEFDKLQASLDELRKSQDLQAMQESQRLEKKGRKQRYRGADEDEYDPSERNRKKEKRKQKKTPQEEVAPQPSPLYLPEFISVGNLATVLGVRQTEFIDHLEEIGFERVLYSHVLDAETAGLIAEEYNFEPIFETGEADLAAAPEPEDKSVLPTRPPVVTIMGHVDHGKTTLLDWLRKSSVAASEHGGITQHIGAFSVTMPSGKSITFLDTPGHAAFLDMRRRGADLTDIVVLVVAADDSVKPQTVEAIKHAKQANVPIIVAINKIDKENVNTEKVKQDLARHSVDVEEYGGDVQAIPVSGKTGQGMLDLEEAIVTLSELLDHRADLDGNAEGWVVEATTKKAGRVATVLIKRGTMRPGDILVAGSTWTRIKTLRNEAGVVIEEATPGMPIEIDGWREQPEAGSEVLQATTEQHAKEIVEYRLDRSDIKKLGQDTAAINVSRRETLEQRRRSEDEASEAATDPTGPKPVNFIIKADVSGSAEAVVHSVTGIGNNELVSNILRSAVGAVSEFDIKHAATSDAAIISFNIATDPMISRMAEAQGVRLMNHNIIYELIDDVKAVMSEHLPPSITHRVTGEAEISQHFEITIKGRNTMPIAGCKVRNGVISRGKKVRVLREKEVIYDGTYPFPTSTHKNIF
jgi:translation initiation factor IF-2